MFHPFSPPKAATPSSDPCFLRLTGLPKICFEDDLIEFFKGLEIKDNRIIILRDNSRKCTGTAYVEFVNSAVAEEALKKNKEKIGLRCIRMSRGDFKEISKSIERNPEKSNYIEKKFFCKKTKKEVVNDQEKYQVTLHLGDFKSDEIHAKLVDRNLVICAEYKEKPDEHGHISHNIRRTYILPPNVEFDHLSATFSDDGTLVVCAQKKAIEAGKVRVIEGKQLPPSSQTTQKKTETTEKGKINIPVSREAGKN